MKHIPCYCMRLLVGTSLTFFIPSFGNAQGWMEYPFSDCPKDTAATWRRGYIEGYTQSPSIAQGQTVEFKVSTLAAWDSINHRVHDTTCAMKIYRATGRTLDADMLMATLPNFAATFYPLTDSVHQPIYPGDRTRFPRDYRWGCNWATATSYPIPINSPSGFYYAKLFLPDSEYVTTKVGYIPFVVRAAVPGSSSKTLCVIAWNTYQAYNWWGGGSLYYTTGVFGSEEGSNGTPSIPVIRTVSFRRPFGVQWIPWRMNETTCGFLLSANQLGQFDNIYNNPIVRLERYFVSWAYEARDTMEFCVDADINFANQPNGLNLSAYKFIVFPGHSEYWSGPQRQNIEKRPVGGSFMNDGGNLAFFAANNCYWRVDYRPLVSNNPDSMYCDKDWTVRGGRYLWRRQVDIATGDTLHEARFIGAEFMGVNAPEGNYPNIVKSEDHWIFRGTGLHNDSTFGKGTSELLPLAGAEVDRFISNRSPSNTQVLAHRFIRVLTDSVNEPHIGEVSGDSVSSDCTYYEDTGTNSRIFAGGGIGWPGCLFGSDSTVMRAMTTNILDHFSGKKYIGNIYRNLTWDHSVLLRDTVEIDGDVHLLQSKALFVDNGVKLIIDSAVALFVDGELQIPSGASVTINGSNNTWGSLVINNGGVLRLKSNSTLTISPSAYFVLENGGDVVFESGSKLILNHATVEAGATLSVEYGGTLQVQPGGQIAFGNAASIVSYGTLSAIGTTQLPIVFTKLPSEVSPTGIILSSGPNDTLRYCRISGMTTGVSIGYCTATLSNNQFVNCGTAIYSDAFKRSPLIEGNTVDSCYSGIEITTTSYIGTPTVRGNTVNHCTYGLFFNAAYRSMVDDNVISGNTYGVVVVGAAPVFHRNRIEDNSAFGVVSVDGANLRFGDNVIGDPGNNVIRNNPCQVLATSSNPFFGLGLERPAGGWNSLYDNGNVLPLVRAYWGSTVTAEWNWWGQDPPNKDQFFPHDSSYIDYENALPTDPNQNTSPTRTPASVASGVFDGDPTPSLQSITPEQVQLRQAHVLRAQGNYRDAIALYAALIRRKPNAVEARTALSEVPNTYHDFIRASGDSTLQGALEDSLRVHSSSHPNASLRRLANTLGAAETFNRRDFASATTKYQQLLLSAATDADRVMCLFALFNVNANGLRSRVGAQRWLAEMQTQYPRELRTGFALRRFMTLSDSSSGNGLQKSSLAGNSEHVQLPLEYRLSQNYPNPFNPSTIVKYDLPVATHTHVKMYDIVGREVASLVDEDRPAGYHQVSFDGSRFSSGVYFYRMEAGSFASVKKLVLLK